MKTFRSFVILLFLQSGFLPTIAQPAIHAKVTINADLGKDSISRHIYGHFSEHLGRCIYGGFYVRESNKNILNNN